MSRHRAQYGRGTISLGASCNNRCVFCFYAGARGRPDLTTREALAEIEKAREAIWGGILTLSGGEPTIRPDIVPLCAHARGAGFEGVNLQTNGRALADERLARALARAGVVSCFVSFHADLPSLYARLTGSRPGFAEAVGGLRNLERLGVPFTVNVVITRRNHRRLPRLYDFLRRDFPSFNSLRLSYPRLTGAALANFASVAPRFGAIGPYVRRTIDLARRDGIEVLCDQIPTCVLGRHAECDIARTRECFYISDPAPDGALGPEYSLKYGFCARCRAAEFCCGVPLEYARRFAYRAELRPMGARR